MLFLKSWYDCHEYTVMILCCRGMWDLHRVNRESVLQWLAARRAEDGVLSNQQKRALGLSAVREDKPDPEVRMSTSECVGWVVVWCEARSSKEPRCTAATSCLNTRWGPAAVLLPRTASPARIRAKRCNHAHARTHD
jgi:hypothetical protein